VPYTLIDHTADVGIQIKTKSLAALFTEAAEGLFDQIVDRKALMGEKRIRIEVQGFDLPDLMVNWLRELLYLWNGKALLVKAADVQSITDSAFEAAVSASAYDPSKHTIVGEIKAITYHRISVDETPDGWESLVILDV